jgi:hypothetical protein
MSVTALSVKAETWKQPRCPPVEQTVRHKYYSKEYYSKEKNK